MKRLLKIVFFTTVCFIGLFLIIIASNLLWDAVKAPSYNGKPLYKLLAGDKSEKRLNLTLNQLLSVTPIATNSVTGDITFEAPANFDAISKLGDLCLAINGRRAEFQECRRATNGGCILIWNSIFDPPSQCQIQAMLRVYKELTISDSFKVMGPAIQYSLSNNYQIDITNSGFDERSGWFIHAMTIQSNIAYNIEIQTTDGKLIRTIAGSTSNGVITEHWDLTDDSGNRYTNIDELSAAYHIRIFQK